mmetsp:Transcript_14924/g.37940  ORF Transcript_14924/g.37940 Transcript_14924/m.37940 type:complete len:212 (+) Transcript_14924:121-756(+)
MQISCRFMQVHAKKVKKESPDSRKEVALAKCCSIGLGESVRISDGNGLTQNIAETISGAQRVGECASIAKGVVGESKSLANGNSLSKGIEDGVNVDIPVTLSNGVIKHPISIGTGTRNSFVIQHLASKDAIRVGTGICIGFGEAKIVGISNSNRLRENITERISGGQRVGQGEGITEEAVCISLGKSDGSTSTKGELNVNVGISVGVSKGT